MIEVVVKRESLVKALIESEAAALVRLRSMEGERQREAVLEGDSVMRNLVNILAGKGAQICGIWQQH
jgi:hypothetical protein